MTTDARFMAAALHLARRNLGQSWPNPAVGALIVGAGCEILGRGATARSGRPHAETIALQEAGAQARGATCYVTLEPCAHHGRTPPCAQALIDAGIARVVYASDDPDTRVAGRGAAMLKEAGIAVEGGLCAGEGALANAGHILRVRDNRPFVTLKLALSADGAYAGENHGTVAITGDETRRYVHMMRARHDAILVGRATAEEDDPALTCRLPGMEDRSPVRVVLDSGFRVDPGLKMFAGGPETWVVGAIGAEAPTSLKANAARILTADGAGSHVSIASALAVLAGEGITRLMVEGGGAVAAAFLASGLVDEIVTAVSPRTWAQIAPDAGAGRTVPALAQATRGGAYEPVLETACGADTVTLWRRRGLAAALIGNTEQG